MTTIQRAQNANREIFLHSPAVRMKMFIHSNPKDVEKAINEWIEENDVMIHHIAQSQSEKSGSFVFVMTLFYSGNH